MAQHALHGQAPAAERGAGLSCRSELITDCTPTGDAKVPRCFTAGLQERYRCAREPQGNLTLYDLIKSGQARSDPWAHLDHPLWRVVLPQHGHSSGQPDPASVASSNGRQRPAGEPTLGQQVVGGGAGMAHLA